MPDPDDGLAAAAVASDAPVLKGVGVGVRSCLVVLVAVVWSREGEEGMDGVVLGPLRRAADARLTKVVVCRAV